MKLTVLIALLTYLSRISARLLLIAVLTSVWVHPQTIHKATDVRSSGALGDGVHDDTTAIKQALTGGGIVYFPAGVYNISSPLRPSSFTEIVGVGEVSQIRVMPNITQGFGIFVLSSVQSVTISKLLLNGMVSVRAANGATAGIFVNASKKCRIEDITFVDFGAIPHPSGNIVTIEGVDGVGSADDNSVVHCKLFDAEGHAAFGIRVYTRFQYDPGAVESTVTAARNAIVENLVVGCSWNAIEIAGPRTIGNRIIQNFVYNHLGFGGVEADKGASNNTYEGNTVLGVLGTSQPSFAFRDQGYNESPRYRHLYSRHNVWRNNSATLYMSLPLPTAVGCMVVDDSQDAEIVSLRCTLLANGGIGLRFGPSAVNTSLFQSSISGAEIGFDLHEQVRGATIRATVVQACRFVEPNGNDVSALSMAEVTNRDCTTFR